MPRRSTRARELGLGDSYHLDPAEAVRDADLVIVCVPVGACGSVGQAIANALKPGAIVTDVGSIKGSVITQMKPLLPKGVHFVPGASGCRHGVFRTGRRLCRRCSRTAGAS